MSARDLGVVVKAFLGGCAAIALFELLKRL